MISEIVLKRVAILILGILGPILCYIIVYGFFEVIRIISLQIKARRFKKRMEIANANKERDEFGDIEDDVEVEIITSKEIDMEEEKDG